MATVDSTSESLILARLDREYQGPWEAEYSYGDEADLHRHYDSCNKNPGHENFIPVDKFKIEDLPEGYQDQDVVDYIRAMSGLTVRVTVMYVSASRPATVFGSSKPYPGHNVRGRKRITVGTGYVNDVEISKRSKRVPSCKCKECRNSSTPVMDFATFTIHTATHVVFDELEGQHTTCYLFFDRGDTPGKCQGVVPLESMSDVRSEVNEDVCYMKHYTHDLDLACRLQQIVEQMQKLSETIMAKLRNICKFKQTPVVPDRQPLLFIVSHPHGCSKQVSLGRWTRVEMFCSYMVSFVYNTATCPGSSGAQMCVLAERVGLLLFGRLSAFRGVHGGASKMLPECNFCNIDGGFATHKQVALEMLQMNKDTWRDNFCCVEAEDQGKHYASFKKNSGLKNCFPLEAFTMDNLPPFYRKDNIMKFVKLMSALTARVSVNYVSQKRPETVPGTDIPYPWSKNKGSSQMRVGSGWVESAGIFNQDCRCQECKNTLKPKPMLACINITTAAHLVYNKQETEHTTCHLFFDSGETPDACKDVVVLTDILYSNTDIAHDTCSFECYTHNLDLVRQLSKMTSQYSHEHYSLFSDEDLKSTNYIKQNGGQNAKQETALQIMVSHPHGCSKHVTIECCGNPGDVDTEDSLSPQTAMYCPGSSGAPVFVLGRQLLYPSCELGCF